jgi:GntR family transcriptional regulator
MLVHLDKGGGVAVYRQIVDQLRHQIVSGRMAPGAQLVSVRDLAADLAVNPMTVSKAYGQLEKLGLVERRAGVGLFVASGGGARKADRLALLEPSLGRAATEAHHLHVSEEDALALFSKLFRRTDRREGIP